MSQQREVEKNVTHWTLCIADADIATSTKRKEQNMGRAERRKAERRERIESRKGKILISREDLNEIKKDITHEAAGYNTEALMTCFALVLSRQGFDADHIGECIVGINLLMDAILDGEVAMEDYIKELEDDTGIIIKCGE